MLDASKRLRGLLVGFVVVLVVVCAWYPPIQNLANEQVDAGLKRALISFATARTLNGVISVIQGTEIAMTPAGVGVTLTLGQILDPINDLVEEFSSWMLVASVAFGVQKMLLVVGAHWLISLLVTAFAFTWAVLHFRGASPQWLTRTVLVLLLVRFAIPVATLGSELVFQKLMAKDYLVDQAALVIAANKVGKAGPEQTAAMTSAPDAPRATTQAEAPGTKSWLRGLFDREGGSPEAAAPAEERGLGARIKDRLNGFVPEVPNLGAIKAAVEEVPERIVKLIVIFLMQTMIVPIFLLWAMLKVASGALGLGRASGPIA